MTSKTTLLPAVSLMSRGPETIVGDAAGGVLRRRVPLKPTTTASVSLAATAVKSVVVPELRRIHVPDGSPLVRIVPRSPAAMKVPLKNVIPRK